MGTPGTASLPSDSILRNFRGLGPLRFRLMQPRLDQERILDTA